MRYVNCAICMLIMLMTVTSVDITPKALELLNSYDDSGIAWISDTYYA